MKQKSLLREKGFLKNVLALVVPMALQNLINVGVGMTDTMMAGWINETALSGASLANQVMFILTLIVFGLSSGASVLTAQYWGKGDTDSICRLMGIAMRIALIAALAFTACAVFLPQQVMRIFTPEQEVIEVGARYLRIVGMSYLFAAFSMLYLNVIRSIEKVLVSLIVYSISFFLNIFLNWMLVFGNLGMRPLGIEGAAIATLSVKVLEAVITLVYAAFFNKRIRFRLAHLFMRSRVLMRDFCKYALPVEFNELLWGLGISMQSVVLGHLGSEVVAANSIAKVAQQLATVVMFGVASSTAVIIGKAIGAGNMEFARRASGTLMRIAVITGALGGGLILLCRPLFAGMYPSLSAEALDYMKAMMLILACYIPIQSYCTTAIVGIMRGGGDAKFAMVIDTVTLWGVALVAGSVGAFWLNWSVPVVYMLLLSDEAVKLLFAVFRLRSGKWLSNVTRDQSELRQQEN